LKYASTSRYREILVVAGFELLWSECGIQRAPDPF
jgi:hypothetical protein